MPQVEAPTGRWRRALAWWAGRDPGARSAQRAVRAAVVVPVAYALGLATGNQPLALFAVFGAFAGLLLVEFTGPRRLRLEGYAGLGAAGVVFVAVGTLCSRSVPAAVAATVVVAFGVLFTGVASPRVSQATTAALLLFVLPVAVPAPPGQIPARLGGLALAWALVVPAALFWWPIPWRSQLRAEVAATTEAIAVLVDSAAAADPDPAARAAAEAAVSRLRRHFEATAYLPTGAAPGDDALCRVVGRLEWTEMQMARATRTAVTDLALPFARALNAATADLLRACAAVVTATGLPGGPTAAQWAAVTAARAAVGGARDATMSAAIDRYVADVADHPTPVTDRGPGACAPLLPGVDPTFRARVVSDAAVALADDVEQSRQAERGPLQRAGAYVDNLGRRLAAHARPGSVWLRNSVRGTVGLAAAVGVATALDVQHGFWVVLGTLSVLRSNALGTGATALRALVGTVLGVAVGSVVLWALGDQLWALWLVLPVAVLLAGTAPTVIGFAAGQGAFSLTVLVLFKILEPHDTVVGLVRVENVAIGCAVAAVVSVLFWPRGAGRVLGADLSDAYGRCSAYLGAALERILSPRYDVDTTAAHDAAVASLRRVDDAFRQYLAERGAKTVPAADLVTLMTGAVMIRMGAEALANLPAQPLDPTWMDEPATAAAADALRRACAEAEGWYRAVGDVMNGRAEVVPPVPDHRATLHSVLLAAFDRARASGQAGRIRAMLRALWADEDLEDQHALQVDLARAAALVAEGRRRSARLGLGPRRGR